MADQQETSLDEPAVCPSSPRASHARIFVDRGKKVAAAINNLDRAAQPPPVIPPLGLFGKGWAQLSPPPGFENVRTLPTPPPGTQTPPTRLIFGTSQRPPPIATHDRQLPDSTVTAHGPAALESSIIGKTTAPPDETSLAEVPEPDAAPATQHGIPRAVYSQRYTLTGMEKCHALATTRIYNSHLRCDRCGGRSSLGWYYRCVHETDTRLYESIQNGNDECFDDIGKRLTQTLQPPIRGPSARQDALAPLNELSPQALQSLSSTQLATVLRQHENAVNTALKDRHGAFVPPADEKPFLMPQVHECRTTLCPSCGRVGNGEQQAFLSLDGVLKDDIPAAAAVGFGFRTLGGRPVANANVVRNLGLRDLKTGLLPGEQAKRDTTAATGQSSWVAVDDVGASSVDDSNLSERTATLNLAEADSKSLNTGSVKPGDSAEDLLQLYLDYEENSVSGSLQEESVGGNAKAHV